MSILLKVGNCLVERAAGALRPLDLLLHARFVTFDLPESSPRTLLVEDAVQPAGRKRLLKRSNVCLASLQVELVEIKAPSADECLGSRGFLQGFSQLELEGGALAFGIGFRRIKFFLGSPKILIGRSERRLLAGERLLIELHLNGGGLHLRAQSGELLAEKIRLGIILRRGDAF